MCSDDVSERNNYRAKSESQQLKRELYLSNTVLRSTLEEGCSACGVQGQVNPIRKYSNRPVGRLYAKSGLNVSNAICMARLLCYSPS